MVSGGLTHFVSARLFKVFKVLKVLKVLNAFSYCGTILEAVDTV